MMARREIIVLGDGGVIGEIIYHARRGEKVKIKSRLNISRSIMARQAVSR